jgi:hypothetical protein
MTLSPWLALHQRAVRRGYSFDEAAAVADHWQERIGTARPDEPADALTLCAAGSLFGRIERHSGGPLDLHGLPPYRQRRKGGADA